MLFENKQLIIKCIENNQQDNLYDFSVDIKNSINLRKFVPSNIIFVSESGIKEHLQIKELKKNSVNAVLIGETFMKSKNKKLELTRLKGKGNEN